MKIFLKISLILFFTKPFIHANNELSCKDENGNSIDWFFLYKLPRLNDQQNTNTLIQSGSAYVFLTELNPNWQLSSHSINDTQSMPALTLNTIYDKDIRENNQIGYVLYNDQADRVTVTKGHTKGVILFDDSSVVWIIHSIPHYPPKSESGHYYINASQLIFGQSMLCIRTKFETMDTIGQQLLYNYPQIYDYFIPKSLLTKYRSTVLDNLISTINGAHVEAAPWYNLNYIKTLTGQYSFLSFAKFTSYAQDLYSGLVAQSLQSNLNVETWNNGQGTLSSNCTLNYHVLNIEHLSFDNLNVSFSVHKDHSKWTVTTSENKKVICIGDINRQEDQFKRGGGTVCLINEEKIWSQYSKLIKDTQNC